MTQFKVPEGTEENHKKNLDGTLDAVTKISTLHLSNASELAHLSDATKKQCTNFAECSFTSVATEKHNLPVLGLPYDCCRKLLTVTCLGQNKRTRRF